MKTNLLRQLPSLLLLLTGSAAALAADAGSAPAPAAPAAASFPLETYAALGSNFAQNALLRDLGWSEAQFGAFLAGLRATYEGHPYNFDDRARQLHDAVGRRIQEIAARAQQAQMTQLATPAGLEAFMKEAVKRFNLQRSDSGLAFALVPRGETVRPGPDDEVILSCSAVGPDLQTEIPALGLKEQRIKVAKLPPGLAEGVQMMTKSSSGLFVLPPDLSFGAGPWPAGVPAGVPLVYTVVLHDIAHAP